jgi:hypothetical protein
MNLGPSELFIWAAVAVGSGVLSGFVAERKGYSYAVWALVGFLLGCIGLLIALFLPDIRGRGVVAGTVVRLTRSFPIEDGGVLPKGHDSKVHDVDVKEGTPAALIDAPAGARYWVPISILRSV